MHTIWNTLLSARFAEAGYVPLEGYELLKGLAGVTTHAHRSGCRSSRIRRIIDELAAELAAALSENPDAHGVLLSRHGLYTWGKSVAEARRHLEALEFLFEVEGGGGGGCSLPSRTAPDTWTRRNVMAVLRFPDSNRND